MRAFAAVILLGCTAPPPAAAVSLHAVTPQQQRVASLQSRRPGASRVHFQGHHALPRDDLLSVLHFPATGAYEDDQLAADAVYLQALYYDRGYLESKVTPERTGADAVTFRIEEGDRYRIGKLDIYDADVNGLPMQPPDGVPGRSHFRSKPGDWFARNVMMEDLAALRRVYQDAGYALSEIEPDTHIDRERSIIDISILKMDLGPVVLVDHVEVIGSQIPTESVLAEIDIAPGSRYSATKLERARKRLLATGWYDEVAVSLADMTRDHPRVTEKFEVKPRR